VYYSAPAYNLDTKEWTKTPFESRKIVAAYIKSQVRYPGEYNLKYTEGYWNEAAKGFQKNGFYPKFVKNSTDYKKYWDHEKEKCAFEGFIIYKKPSEGIEFAVPGLYYWYLNYCPIPDKVKQADDFAEIYDGDYHYFLYILRCLILRKFGVVLKKRQSGYSLKNMAIILNAIWFGKSAITKIFAIDESKVRESWGFMTKYRDHITTHTAWKRNFDPAGILDWQIKRKQNDGTYKGNMSIAKGITTKQDPTRGVGGAAKVIFGEEAGTNPTLDQTHEFITSNVSYGGLTTGLIIYSGAVGKLESADPLKEFITHPNDHGFLGCPNNIEDDIEFGDEVGFFAPEWWNYVSVEEDDEGEPVGEIKRCFDEWGNTNKAEALKEMEKWAEKARKGKTPEKFRLWQSQRPLSIKQAFAFRVESKFPLNLVQAQKRRILDKEYSAEYVDIVRNEFKELSFEKSFRLPIMEFPLSKGTADKEGCIVIYERPIGKPELGKQYVASIDPIRDGKSTTSVSLFSILIYKLDIEVTRYGDDVENWIEPGKLVAEWTGRFDDINKTHERAMMMLEIYGAKAVVEANVSEFINFMIGKRKQHYLVPKNQILFLKELGANESAFQEYGWKNTGKIFENHLIQYAIGFLKEEINVVTDKEGNVYKTIYGIERLPSIMLMKEIEAYVPGLNVDRLVAFAALTAYIKIYLANYGFAKRIQGDDKPVQKGTYLTQKSFFKKTKSSTDSRYTVKKGFLKNMR